MTPDRDAVAIPYVRIIRRRRTVVLTAIVACVVGSYLLSSAQTSVYEASTEVLVQPRAIGSIFTAPATPSAESAARLIATEAEFIESTMVRTAVQADLQLREPPPPVDAQPIEGTDVIRLTVRNADPASAAAVVDSYTEAFIEIRRDQAVADLTDAIDELAAATDELQRQIDAMGGGSERDSLIAQKAALDEAAQQLRVDAGLRTGGASIIESADIPSEPVAPNPRRTALLALLVGALIGVAAALMLDTLDNVVYAAEDIARVTGLPVLATLPDEAPLDHRPMAFSQPNTRTVDRIRTLGTDIQLLAIDREITVICITSAVGGEGGTTIAANLAVAMARAGRRVALVDVNLRQPKVHEMFGLPAAPGLTDIVLGAPIGGAMHSVTSSESIELDLLPAGGRPPHPGELLSSQRFRDIIAGLRSSYEIVILDATAVMPVSDTLALAPLVDTVVVAARSGRVTRPQLERALARLRRVHAPVDGIVLTFQPDAPDADDTAAAPSAPGDTIADDAPAPVVTFDFGDEPPLFRRILLRLGIGRR